MTTRTVLARQGPLGILSIDIDGNDYWIWQAITSVQPAIVICEFNAVLGDMRPIVVPYDSAFQRLRAHFSGQYFGASIAALKSLARAKGYTFVGTNSNGVNAFFLKEELAAKLKSVGLTRPDQLAMMTQVRASTSPMMFITVATFGRGRRLSMIARSASSRRLARARARTTPPTSGETTIIRSYFCFQASPSRTGEA